MSENEKVLDGERAERERAVANFRDAFPESAEPALCFVVRGGALSEAAADRLGRLSAEVVRELRAVLAEIPEGATLEVSLLRESPGAYVNFRLVEAGALEEVYRVTPEGDVVLGNGVPEAVPASPTAATVPVDVPGEPTR